MANHITEEDIFQFKDQLMINEGKRLASFRRWPFITGPCTKQKMAQAGFYYYGGGDDAVRCFVCFKDLTGWESTDVPFDEHQNHSAECTFASLACPQDELPLKEWLKILNERQMNIHKNRLMDKRNKLKSKLDKIAKCLESVN